MENRTVLKLFGLIAPWLTWLFTLFLPGRNASVAKNECANKCRIMGLVQSLGGYVDPEGKTPQSSIMEKCYALGPFPALWAVEGVGKDLAEMRMKRGGEITRLLIDTDLDANWDKALLMLHAGIGLGFAKHYVERLPAGASNEEVTAAVRKIVDLCRANSKPGYYGAALESLGLVSRFMKTPAFCRQVHEALVAYASDSVDFFWRGAGRCLYFHPSNFVPGLGDRPCRAIDMSKVEAPSPALRECMLSGTAWPLNIVNMDTPEVMEWVLEHPEMYDVESPAFVNGVISSVVMRHDTTPGFERLRTFRNHVPPTPKARALWETKIKASIDFAIERVHPVLKKHQRLDEVFRYQDLGALIARLEKGSA